MDFIFRHANLPDGRSNIDIGILGDRIVAVQRGLAAPGATEVDALGRVVSVAQFGREFAPIAGSWGRGSRRYSTFRTDDGRWSGFGPAALRNCGRTRSPG